MKQEITLYIKPNPSEKKTLEFSQKLLISMLTISTIFTACSYALSFLDKNPVESLSSTIVTVLWGSSSAFGIGYVAQNAVRAWSQNKYTDNSSSTDIVYNERRNERGKL